MTARLAKLADLKAALGTTETAQDSLLLRCLITASEMAERLTGLAPGDLRRAQEVVEYPSDPSAECRRQLYLARFPVESIASVKQLYLPSSPVDFDAETSLVEDDDYSADYARGVLEQITSIWFLRRKCVQVIYTAGYADPAMIPIALTEATWEATTQTLTQAAAFADYTFAPGDCIVVTGGTGAAPGTYLVGSQVGDDAIVLALAAGESLSLDGGSLAAGDITSAGGASSSLIPPGDELQAAVVQQSIQLKQRIDAGGNTTINLGAGGSINFSDKQAHPDLVAVCQTMRRVGQ